MNPTRAEETRGQDSGTPRQNETETLHKTWSRFPGESRHRGGSHRSTRQGEWSGGAPTRTGLYPKLQWNFGSRHTADARQGSVQHAVRKGLMAPAEVHNNAVEGAPLRRVHCGCVTQPQWELEAVHTQRRRSRGGGRQREVDAVDEVFLESMPVPVMQ